MEGISQSHDLVSRIAHSTKGQSDAIGQINLGIDQVTQVVQQNTATSQESATASLEMSRQATLLEELVARFQLRGNPVKEKHPFPFPPLSLL